MGAGPVGLLLAGELRLGGAEVVVLESLTEPMTESRASTLHARTMEFLDSRGLAERWQDVPVEPRGHFGGIGMDLTVPSPFSGQWKVPQADLEAQLARWAQSLGATIRRGVTVTSIEQDGSGVRVFADGADGSLGVHADWVVGCDGEHSTVRRLVGADFPGHDATRELMRADVAGIEIEDRRFQRLERGFAVAARRPDGVTRVMVCEFDRASWPRSAPPAFEEISAAWHRVTGEDIGHGTPLWCNAFDDTCRQLSSYRHGRVLFAGDAAHRQLPVGGQALNLGLQDAANLGWKLALQLRRGLPEDYLDSYHSERHPAGQRVLTDIDAQARLQLGDSELEPVRQVMAELIALEPVRAHLAGLITGVDVGYPTADDSAESPARRVTPGQFLVDGAPTTASSLLRDGRGLLLDPSEDGRVAAAALGWREYVDLVRTGPGEHDTGDRTALLVRPDGYVAWTGDGPDPSLTAAMRRWFGPQESAPPPATEPASRSVRTAITPRKKDNLMRLTGKTALVTGASRGMGRATARRLAADGALVAVHFGQHERSADDLVSAIEADGGRAFTVQADLGRPSAAHELFLSLERSLKERTGTTELNILVNNAGVMTGGGSPEDTTSETFDRVFAINAKAPFFLIQRALQNMPDGGRIINISSGLTRFANPDEIAYAMSKGAVEQLALHFAKYLGPRRITVNSVAPGITRNDNPVFDIPEAVEQMSQLSVFGRVGEPEDVADVVAFLASDDARWTTGAFIDASGGTLLG